MPLNIDFVVMDCYSGVFKLKLLNGTKSYFGRFDVQSVRCKYRYYINFVNILYIIYIIIIIIII